MTQILFARSFRPFLFMVLCTAFSIALITATPVHAASFTVNTTIDAPDNNPGDGLCRSTAGNRCTLRAAIQEANALSGTDTINVPAGTFILTRSGSDDTAVNGDLDINSTLIINGAGQSSTIIDGNDLDRVFHITGNFKVAMTNLTIQDGNQTGTGLGGGGIANLSGTLFLTNVTVTSNLAFEPGGALFNGGTATLNGVTITSNSASTGGGIINTGTLNITQSLIRDNSSTTGTGGGIANTFGGMTITFTIIANNVATTSGSGGGMDILGGSTKIENSTISGNVASGTGGGIKTGFDAIVTIINSTISGNSAGTTGGGVSVNGGTVSIASTTITENNPIGINNGSGVVRLKNSILGGNLGVGDCQGTLESLAYNLIQVDTCTITGDTTGNLIGVSPDLAPLTSVGGCGFGDTGPTPIHCPNMLSPVLDAANPAGCTDFNGVMLSTDQRGPGPYHSRHYEYGGFGRCDIGAIEINLDL